MKSTFLLLSIILLLFSCRQEVSDEKISVTPFNLQTDYLDFTDKLNLGDTLELSFDMSVCSFFSIVSLKVIREKDNFRLLTKIKDFYPYSDTLFSKIFSIPEFKIDSLLASEVFYDKYPLIKADTATHYAHCFMIYKSDTLKLQQKESYNVGTKNEFNISFKNVMRNYYPELHYFEALNLPSPPPATAPSTK